MDINFPLILVLLVFASGLIWLYDIDFLSKRRQMAITAVDNQFDGIDTSDQSQKQAYDQAKSVAAREPAPVEYAKSFFPVFLIVLLAVLRRDRTGARG